MHAIWFMLTALAVLAIGYRYYSAFIAAKVLTLSDERVTPAHTCRDGSNFHATNKYVLFGHHFAAITGAGPLIGPVFAAQFGFLPGYIWILFGVVFGGAVHDFVILVSSVRRKGRSLADIAHEELGPVLGMVTGAAILFIVVIALAGLGTVVVGALAESAWGVFTIGLSIPIALGMGLYIYKVRGGSEQGIREATVVGVVLLMLALIFGKTVQDGSMGEHLKLSRSTLTYAMAAYGFAASVLPVWMLLCPRDYLSSYLKIGTIALLVLGIILVNPVIEMPLLNDVSAKAVVVGGETFTPIVAGQLYPFVFITIACGAISGFHALVASGTTPKMIDKESHCRGIGYGAMLMEGLVGVTALLAATALPPSDYFAINTDPRIPVVAAAGGHGLAASADDLARLEPVLTPTDRRHLGLKPGQPVSEIERSTVKASEVLHLSNRALGSARLPRRPDQRNGHRAYGRRLLASRDPGHGTADARQGEPRGHRGAHGRRGFPRGRHVARLRRSARNEDADRLLVSLCHHVRSAVRAHHHRHRDARGAFPLAGVRGADVEAVSRAGLAAGRDHRVGGHRGRVVLLHPHGKHLHHLADVRYRQSAARVDRAGGGHDDHPAGSEQADLRADHAGAARLRGYDDDHGGGDGHQDHVRAPHATTPKRTRGASSTPWSRGRCSSA